eukprot:CAMPEP_0204259540 /NCGR_PEP_ID=MMETSP0468-20130131/5710_1 /ASSEMBLY_ACC=CAM_ASM_000383 /TAXON_ID=2969 /ORGANISM="Oxyrrhis marina" /LENGTH=52 /DNA_ID=CAMNT_0051233845 /DNA_START=168 /DNA_END=326 /DNA_ORIENTATION=+
MMRRYLRPALAAVASSVVDGNTASRKGAVSPLRETSGEHRRWSGDPDAPGPS